MISERTLIQSARIARSSFFECTISIDPVLSQYFLALVDCQNIKQASSEWYFIAIEVKVCLKKISFIHVLMKHSHEHGIIYSQTSTFSKRFSNSKIVCIAWLTNQWTNSLINYFSNRFRLLWLCHSFFGSKWYFFRIINLLWIKTPKIQQIIMTCFQPIFR